MNRRSFLKLLGVGAVAAFVGKAASRGSPSSIARPSPTFGGHRPGALLGYKGGELWEAEYIWAPYQPISAQPPEASFADFLEQTRNRMPEMPNTCRPVEVGALTDYLFPVVRPTVRKA